jgi:hypothetical protein
MIDRRAVVKPGGYAFNQVPAVMIERAVAPVPVTVAPCTFPPPPL